MPSCVRANDSHHCQRHPPPPQGLGSQDQPVASPAWRTRRSGPASIGLVGAGAIVKPLPISASRASISITPWRSRRNSKTGRRYARSVDRLPRRPEGSGLTSEAARTSVRRPGREVRKTVHPQHADLGRRRSGLSGRGHVGRGTPGAVPPTVPRRRSGVLGPCGRTGTPNAQRARCLTPCDSSSTSPCRRHSSICWIRLGNCGTRDVADLLRLHRESILRFVEQDEATFLALG